MKTNKIISIVVLLAVLAATVAGAYLGFAGRNTQMVTVDVNGVETERALYRQVAFIPNTFNQNWQEAIVPSAQLGGGVEYTFIAEQGDMTDKDFAKAVKSAAKVMGKRAELLVGDSSVSCEGDTISVTVPAKDYDSSIASILTPAGDFTLALYDANTGLFTDPVLTDAHIKKAGYYADSTTYQLQLQLNKAGQKALASVAAAHPGEMLYLLESGAYWGYFTLTGGMDTEFINVSVDDWSYALSAAVCMMSGKLPVTVGLTDYVIVEGTLSSVLNVVVMGMLIVTVLAMLFVILRGKTVGCISALTIAAQGVVFSLLTALSAVSSSWKLSLSALVLLTLCQLLFLAGVVITNENIASQGKNRGLRQAIAHGAKSTAKPLCIVYGALVVLGVALMILFSQQPAAVMGRIIAISGIVSFAAIFVALRVLLSCLVSIKRK